MLNLTDKKVKNFISWLKANGSEIIPTTNCYEVVRFTTNNGTGVIYKGKKGYSASSNDVTHAVNCFLKGRSWSGKIKPSKRVNGSKLKQQAVERDGPHCFFCDKHLEPSEMTLEHLIPINQGGKNTHGNTVIACEPCNKEAGHMSLVEKIKLRDKIRSRH